MLTLARRVRPGGGGRTERAFLDLVVDGCSLLDRLGGRAGDTISPLGWGAPAVEAETRRRLRLDAPRLIGGEREPLLVCAECGELDCGAVTARLTAAGGLVTWSDLAWEGSPAVDPVPIDAGAFGFEWRAYRAVLA